MKSTKRWIWILHKVECGYYSMRNRNWDEYECPECHKRFEHWYSKGCPNCGAISEGPIFEKPVVEEH